MPHLDNQPGRASGDSLKGLGSPSIGMPIMFLARCLSAAHRDASEGAGETLQCWLDAVHRYSKIFAVILIL